MARSDRVSYPRTPCRPKYDDQRVMLASEVCQPEPKKQHGRAHLSSQRHNRLDGAPCVGPLCCALRPSLCHKSTRVAFDTNLRHAPCCRIMLGMASPLPSPSLGLCCLASSFWWCCLPLPTLGGADFSLSRAENPARSEASFDSRPISMIARRVP